MHGETLRLFERLGPAALILATLGAGLARAAEALDLDGRTDSSATHQATRHRIHATGGGHEATNPGQGWAIRFDGRAFSVAPRRGDWRWGLELESYGFPGSSRAVTAPASTRVEGGRLTYAWDELLEEWCVSDRRGLEHGFTLLRRPDGQVDGDGAPLTLRLRARGDLSAQVDAEGRDVAFHDAAGAPVLDYSGLTVFDARGRTLDASFESAGGHLVLSIDEREACYPLTIDPIAQEAYLKSIEPDTDGTVVVGAIGEDSSATGVDGAQADNATPDTFALEARGMPPGVPGLCIKGSALFGGGLGLPIGAGLMCLSTQLRSQVILADAADGNVVMTDWRGQPFGSFPGAANVGAPTCYQWWYRDVANTCTGAGFNFTNAWSVTWQ